MRFIFTLLLFSSASFAQSDSVFTKDQIYSGEIVAVMPYAVFISNDLNLQKGISIYEIQRLVLRNGETVIGDGIPKDTYPNYVRSFNSSREALQDSLNREVLQDSSRSQRFTFQALSDTTRTPLDTAERSTRAIERIALILTIEFGLQVALLIIIFLSLPK